MLLRGISRGALVFVLGMTSATSAIAVTDEERAAARAAAGQGADAFDAGRWQEAVDLFTRAEAVVHSPMHLLFIGRAELKLGHWVKAYEAFNKVKREPIGPDASPAAKRAVEDATAELAQLEPQLPYIAAKVKNPSGDVKVLMDGTPVPPLLVGLMRPVDPGSHKFQATNGQLQSDIITIDARPATRQTVELELRGTAAVAPVPAPTPAPEPATAGATTPGPEEAGGGGTNGLRIASYGAFGLGVAGLAVGTIFLLKSGSTQQEADDLCPTPKCDAALQDEIAAKDEDAASQQTIGAVGLVVGGAAVATGVVLFVLSGNKSSSAKAPSILPLIGYQSVGVAGRF